MIYKRPHPSESCQLIPSKWNAMEFSWPIYAHNKSKRLTNSLNSQDYSICLCLCLNMYHVHVWPTDLTHNESIHYWLCRVEKQYSLCLYNAYCTVGTLEHIIQEFKNGTARQLQWGRVESCRYNRPSALSTITWYMLTAWINNTALWETADLISYMHEEKHMASWQKNYLLSQVWSGPAWKPPW